MAQQGQCLLNKVWEPELGSPAPMQKPSVATCICNPKAEMHKDRQIPRARWSSSRLVISKLREKPFPKIRWKAITPYWTVVSTDRHSIVRVYQHAQVQVHGQNVLTHTLYTHTKLRNLNFKSLWKCNLHYNILIIIISLTVQNDTTILKKNIYYFL